MRTLWLLLIAPCLSSRLSAQTAAGTENATPTTTVERLRTDVFRLADDSMRGRVVGTAEYRTAAEYVVAQLSAAGVAPAFPDTSAGLDGFLQEFEVRVPALSKSAMASWNVVGIVPGTDSAPGDAIVVAGAHLDHVAWPHERSLYNGANDNATGVAVVLEVARQVAVYPAPRTVLFAFFGAEEVGFAGSQRFVESMSHDTRDIAMMVNVDVVGRLGTDAIHRPFIAVVPAGFECIDLIDHAREFGDQLEIGVTDVDINDLMEMSDQVSFRSAGIPVMFVTSAQFPELLHDPTDDAETLDYDQIGQVADLVHLIVRDIASNGGYCDFLRE